MDKVVAAVLLIAVAIAASIGYAVTVQKIWTGAKTINSLDFTGSYIALNPNANSGNATVALHIQNTGTTVAYLTRITIIPSTMEVYFVNNHAYLTPIPSRTMNVSVSSNKVYIDAAWFYLPPSESATVTGTHAGMNTVVSIGSSYLATAYTYSGQIETFRLTVQSA